MIPIVTQNSVLSQNWVECIVNTPMAQAADRPRAHCAQAARIAPCRSSHWAVSWQALALCRGRARPCRRPCRGRTLPCRKPPGHDTKFVSQHKALSCAMSQGSTALYHSLAALYCDTKLSPPATIRHLYRNSPASQATQAHCRTPLRATSHVVAHVGRVAGPPVVAPYCTPQCPVSRYNPLYRDSTGKWAIAHSSFCVFCNFFFSLIFFIFFHLLEDHKKILLLLFFIFR